MEYIRLHREWEGETVFIVAGGTSVLQQNTEALRGRKVIAVNSSYERVPFAQYLFFADDRWWKEHRERPALAAYVAQGGKLVTVSKAARELPGGLKLHKLKRVCPVTREARGRMGPGLAASPDSVVAQRTSLQGAMNMAAHLGASCIVLLGADAYRAPDGRSHHHSKHQWANKPGNKTWDIQMTQLALIVEPLQARGIRVINTSLQSRLPWWTKAPLEDVLSGKPINCEPVMPANSNPKPSSPVLNRKKTGYPGGIMFDDEATLGDLVREFNIKRLLEFGPGASTRIFLRAGVESITSCEHDPAWMGRARALYAADPRVRFWSYSNTDPVVVSGLPAELTFDAALVDSPQGYRPEHLRDGMARINTLRYALQRAPVVFLHDAKRDGEQRSLAALAAEGHTVTMRDTRKGIAVIKRK